MASPLYLGQAIGVALCVAATAGCSGDDVEPTTCGERIEAYAAVLANPACDPNAETPCVLYASGGPLDGRRCKYVALSPEAVEQLDTIAMAYSEACDGTPEPPGCGPPYGYRLTCEPDADGATLCVVTKPAGQ